MTYICCVPGCVNSKRKESEVPFKKHRFPQDRLALEIWVKRIGNPKLFKLAIHRFNNYRICSEHFDPICYSPGTIRLNHGSLPTLKLPYFNDDSQSNCNLRFLKNAEEPHEEIEVSKVICKKDNEDLEVICEKDNEDLGTYKSTDLYTITHDLIDTVIQVPDETNKNYALLHKHYKDYRHETEKEMSLILGFFTDKSNKGIYECPRCKYTCSFINDIKVHILAHAEKKICNICYKIFYTEIAAINHSKLHLFNRQITCLSTVEDILEDHQYSLKKS